MVQSRDYISLYAAYFAATLGAARDMIRCHNKLKAESRKQKVESRKQKAESRKQKAESRK